jgi:hypothetical protein
MFKSCELKQLGLAGEGHYITIDDNEFGVATVQGVNGCYDAVILEYSRRNLPVVPNLIRAVLYWNEKYGFATTIQSVLEYNMEYNYLWKPYKEDLQKYLTLF